MGVVMSQARMNKLISNLPGVVKAVADTAGDVADRAKAKLAAHRHQGHAEVTVTHGDVDSFVNLVDTKGKQKAAAAIEFGHVSKDGKLTPGLYIITGAAGLAEKLPKKAR
ncbi:DUF5403 domain-containing protein [Nocardia ninae]|uniref:HK97 gp10 family phage protein n=1 Tax=Nocardia ninae NBRC 108245 TaxID=1210091 RepID=A0A511MK77_9NOCA|nr:DUF5403 family protein [Nocardia ninae]GEM40851.1 hypothetical protein NN4_53700 [Nocardia ninae NBRC 108245]